MTTKNQEEVEVQDKVEEQSAEESEAKQAEEQEITDWETRAKELESEAADLKHKLSSSEGQRSTRQARDERLNRIEDRVVGMGKEFSQFIAHQSRDNPELEAEIAQARSQSSQEANARNFENRHQRIAEEVLDLVQENDSLLISTEDGDKIKSLWSTATAESQKTGDVSLLYEVKIEAQRMVAAEGRKRNDALLTKERKASKEREKKALEKAGVFNQDTGPVTGGGGDNLSTLDKMSRSIADGRSRIKM